MLPAASTIKYISFSALKQAYTANSVKLVDVRTPEAFAEGHIPGAANYCVYEVKFIDKISEALEDKDSKVIVYGESSAFKAAEVAYGRLQQAGFKHVEVFSGGLSKWIAEGGKVEITKKPGSPSLVSGRLDLERETSRLRWFGRNPMNQHEGCIAFKSGWIELEEGGLTGGEVVVDMQAITCNDIDDEESNKALIAHLGNADFFKVDSWPEAGFSLKSAEPIPENTPGQPNLRVAGDMTVRGVTRNTNFRAMLTPVDGGMSFQAQFDLNRVLFGAVYGSGSLFERLGMHLVNDLVNVQITAIFKAD